MLEGEGMGEMFEEKGVGGNVGGRGSGRKMLEEEGVGEMFKGEGEGNV